MAATAIWSLGILLLALGLCVPVVRLRRSAKPLAAGAESEIPSRSSVLSSPILGRLGLLCSTIGLSIALYLVPGAKYLPENIEVPVFVYSLLAFPVFVALGAILSIPGYIATRHRVNLAAMIVGGLALAWLMISLALRL